MSKSPTQLSFLSFESTRVSAPRLERKTEAESIACEVIEINLCSLVQFLNQFERGLLSRQEMQMHLQRHASAMDEAHDILEQESKGAPAAALARTLFSADGAA
jgi:hypothetical protein